MIALLPLLMPPTLQNQGRIQDFTLSFGGDLMFEGITPRKQPLEPLMPIFRSSEIACANLESPLTIVKATTKRKSALELRRHQQYILGGNPKFASEISKAGIEFVTLANNHTMDHQTAGLRQDTAVLAGAGIHFAGAGANRSQAMGMTVINSNGTRIGFLSALAFMTPGALYKCTPATST